MFVEQPLALPGSDKTALKGHCRLGYLLEKEPAVGVLQLPETFRRPLKGSQDQLPLPGLGVPEESQQCQDWGSVRKVSNVRTGGP